MWVFKEEEKCSGICSYCSAVLCKSVITLARLLYSFLQYLLEKMLQLSVSSGMAMTAPILEFFGLITLGFYT